MDQSELEGRESLRRAAEAAIRRWSPEKAAMALQAAGLDGAERPSLDSIAADSGVSRETVRRARNELLVALNAQTNDPRIRAAYPLTIPTQSAPDGTPATARALRRLLTITGPLPWDEVLTAWARARGKPPYAPLPTDVVSMRRWAETAGGFVVSPEVGFEGVVTIDVNQPEALDQVGQFLNDALRGRPGGVDRVDLLSSVEEAGLKPTTIATALSQHPAVIRLGRGSWALRGQSEAPLSEVIAVAAPRKAERPRPTKFGWGGDGSLVIEFSIPRGPSPVVAVPKAVAELVEGREFAIGGTGRPTRISIGNARLWGFGPLVSEIGLSRGQRAQITLNLIAGTARFAPAELKER